MERRISVGIFRPKYVDHLQRWSWIFRSEETETDLAIWIPTEISAIFGIMVSTLSDRCFRYFTAAMFVPLRRKQTWRLETNLYNLSDTLLQITREWKAAETWLLARLSIYQSSIVSQIRDFIHWMVTSFSSDLMTGESQKSFEWSYAAKASQYVSLTNLQSAQPSSLIRRHSWGSVTYSKPKGTFLALWGEL